MLEKLVERVDNRCDVYMRLSTFQSLANEHDDACANAQRAIDLCPDHISPRMSLAAAISNQISSVQTHQQQGDAKILREDFEKMKEGAQKIGQIIEYFVKRNSMA